MVDAGGQRWQRIEEIFHRARNLSAASCEELISAECGDDAALGDEVRDLLKAHRDETQRLEPPTFVETRGLEGDAAGSFVNFVVGGCRLSRLLAEGGMGAVYEATDETLERAVAVKLIKTGWISTQARQRFDYEARILARLVHPGIAHVHAFGSWEPSPLAVPVPYLVMELVPNARTLTEFATEQGLSIDQRIDLFSDVCAAVAHAHQRGVIHRDLKPGNILVDREGRPKVIDFGVARGTEDSAASRTFETLQGSLVGTVPYMSPEQVGADPSDIDVRSDVYALGVILYELLTGRRPYVLEGRSLADAVGIIRERPPTRPSHHRPELAGDLETIVLKSLSKDREARYASAAALSEDLTRWRRRWPIVARPPAVFYQVKLFCSRHRAAVTAFGLGLLALVVATVVSVAASLRSEAARDRETLRRREAELLTDRSSGFVTWVLNDHLPGLDRLAGSTGVRHDLASRVLAYLEEISVVAPRDDSLRRSVAAAALHLAVSPASGSWLVRDFNERAVLGLARVEAVLSDILRGSPHDSSVELHLLRCRMLRLSYRAHGEDHEDPSPELLAIEERLNALGSAPAPEILAVRIHLASLQAELARFRGTWALAVEHSRQAHDLAADLPGDDAWIVQADASWALGVALAQTGSTEEAETVLLAATTQVEQRGPTRDARREAILARLFAARGEAAILGPRRTEAQGHYERALLGLRETLARDPENSSAELGLASTLEGLGSALYLAGELSEARKVLEECVLLREGHAGKDVANVEGLRARVTSLCTLIDVLSRSGDLETARRRLGETQQLLAASAIKDPAMRALRGDVAQRTGTWRMLRGTSSREGIDPVAEVRLAIKSYEESLTFYEGLDSTASWISRAASTSRRALDAARDFLREYEDLPPIR